LQLTVRSSSRAASDSLGATPVSKNLSNVGFNSANINNPNDMDQQYGQTPYSRPHRFFIGYQYEFPFRAEGALSKLVRDGCVPVHFDSEREPLTLLMVAAAPSIRRPADQRW
jgi:hypothetical protein